MRFILESITLTQEVFLHTRIGELYISVPKAIAGSVFLFLTLLLAIFGFSISVHPDPTQIGGVSFLKSFIESVLSFEWQQSYENLRALITTLRNPETRADILWPIQLTVVTFSVFVNAHLLLNFLAKHSIPPRLWHPRSSGEPWKIWDPVYRLGHRYNMRVDLVKQFCEPIACYFIGSFLGSPALTNLLGFTLPDEWRFLVTWLKFGAFFLFLRAYLENRNRKKLTLDRLANEYDARAFELQDELYARESTGTEFVEAVGKRKRL
jgi:hypothetical protein